MTLDEFKAQHIGKKVEFDGKYEYQCVDLTKFYNRDVVNAPDIMGNAVDYVKNPLPGYYDFHDNPLWYIPPAGAIAIWNNKIGDGFGHVGIVLSASIFSFTSLDQNWPTGSPVAEIKHNYTNVAGFLIPRKNDGITKYNMLVDELRALVNRYAKLSFSNPGSALA